MTTHLKDLFRGSEVVLMDGGLGTTLEDIFHINISHTPLWSAKAVVEEPETIIQAHLAFLRAGSRVLLTSTYQCSSRTFERAGYSRTEAIDIMLKSVVLAHEARTRFCDETETAVTQKDIAIALSLGPFGASLSPAQEFDGFYPPPYGPKEYTPTGVNRNSFGSKDHEDADALKKQVEMETTSIEMLAGFHLDRLHAFADDPKVWGIIDCVAFETVPLVREVRAIKKAVTRLQMELEKLGGSGAMKPWWVSLVYPEGRFPETQYSGGPNLPVWDVISAALDRSLDFHDGDTRTALLPTGLGINCTEICFFPEIVEEMGKTVDKHWPQGIDKPWLVVYPNGGDVYDPVTQTWRPAEHQVDSTDRTWADGLGKVINDVRDQQDITWGGIIAGGCCRTGPDEIRALAKTLNM